MPYSRIRVETTSGAKTSGRGTDSVSHSAGGRGLATLRGERRTSTHHDSEKSRWHASSKVFRHHLRLDRPVGPIGRHEPGLGERGEQG